MSKQPYNIPAKAAKAIAERGFAGAIEWDNSSKGSGYNSRGKTHDCYRAVFQCKECRKRKRFHSLIEAEAWLYEQTLDHYGAENILALLETLPEDKRPALYQELKP